MKPNYPNAPRLDIVDDYHGTPVPDPYRWLEDTEADDTRGWWSAQNELVEQFVAQVPAREHIRQRLTETLNFPRHNVPFRHGPSWFQFRNTGLQDQSVLWVGESPEAIDRVLLDPNTLADDGTIALTGFASTKDGSLIAYGTSIGGSDWVTWQFRDVATGKDLPDVLEWSKFGPGSFSADHAFVYNRLEAPAAGVELLASSSDIRVYQHTLGDQQSSDELLWEPPHGSDLIPQARITEDCDYLVLTCNQGASRETTVAVKSLKSGDWVTIASQPTSAVKVIGNEGGDFLLHTDRDAERGRVVRVSLTEPEEWVDVIPEADDALIAVWHVGGRLVAHYLHHAQSRAVVFSTSGEQLRELPVPKVSSLLELSGTPDDPQIHFTIASFTEPGTIYSHDLAAGATEEYWTLSLGKHDVVAEQSFVTSDDGEVQIPVFLVHRRDVLPTGDVPVLLYAYGGFNIPTTPTFSAVRALWVERGGLLAIPNIRGGGEYGKAWHDAARVKTKAKTFDDFCTIAEWLGGDSGWSRADRIAINGGSNGGLLVGACMTRRPELFGACVPEVGVLDIIRFPKFTIGWAWKSDYDDPDTPEGFANIIEWSPLHNVREVSYPATMVMTGDRDDRVVPGHSFKFAAELQAKQQGRAPVLIRVETSTGHGMGKPITKVIAERTDFLAFLEGALDLERADECTSHPS